MNIEKITESMVQLTIKTLTGQELETVTYENISVSIPLELSDILIEASKSSGKSVEDLISASIKETLADKMYSFLKENQKATIKPNETSSLNEKSDIEDITKMLNVDSILNSFKELQELTKDIQKQQDVFESMESSIK